jgi:hypothetical protein
MRAPSQRKNRQGARVADLSSFGRLKACAVMSPLIIITIIIIIIITVSMV